jgi:hypothetical protein
MEKIFVCLICFRVHFQKPVKVDERVNPCCIQGSVEMQRNALVVDKTLQVQGVRGLR